MSRFTYENLDLRTRELMLEEIQSDIDRGVLYSGAYLSDVGRAEYRGALLEAARTGTDVDIAYTLEQPGRQVAFYRGRRVRHDAARQLAEGEFNRFYIRALARRAEETGCVLEVYRAKEVRRPRYSSWHREGSVIADPGALLRDLRTNIGDDVWHRVPGGPGSGLSVRLAETVPDSTRGPSPRAELKDVRE